jgi:hypothetical protein
MGLNIICLQQYFHTSCGYWNIIRMKIAEYCMKFIEELGNHEIDINQGKTISQMSKREIIRRKVIIDAQKIIQEWNDIVEYKKILSLEPVEEGVDDFQAIVNKRYKELNINDYLKVYTLHINYLINIGIYGVISLLNKSDCEGFYSCDDSHYIVLMLNIINKRSDIDSKFIEIINKLNKIFQESIDNKQNVILS